MYYGKLLTLAKKVQILSVQRSNKQGPMSNGEARNMQRCASPRL
jgi:hypothetical protein